MAKAKKNGQTSCLDIPVEFGGVSIGDGTARIGIAIDRGVLNINAADESFCGKRLTGRVVLGHSDESPGQSRFFDDDHQVEGVFDVKRIGVNLKQISTGLTFSVASVDVSELAKLSKGSGRLIVESIEQLPDDSDEDNDDDDEQGELPGTLKAEGPWRDVQLDTLFEGQVLKSLKKAVGRTVGDLADWTAVENNRLTDIEGIGPGKAEKIENRLMQFWQDNPDADQSGK
jgi:hypothetical protein